MCEQCKNLYSDEEDTYMSRKSKKYIVDIVPVNI